MSSPLSPALLDQMAHWNLSSVPGLKAGTSKTSKRNSQHFERLLRQGGGFNSPSDRYPHMSHYSPNSYSLSVSWARYSRSVSWSSCWTSLCAACHWLAWALQEVRHTREAWFILAKSRPGMRNSSFVEVAGKCTRYMIVVVTVVVDLVKTML